jgi:F-type H+-transporting ATPase subunit b
VSIGATLLGQMITFMLFVLFTMRFVWPPIQKALSERQNKVAAGLAAAERGHHDLMLAQESISKQLKDTKLEVGRLLDDAKQQAGKIVEDAKSHAQQEAVRLVDLAHAEIEQLERQAKEALRSQVARIAMLGAEKVLGTSIDSAAHEQLLNQLAEEL